MVSFRLNLGSAAVNEQFDTRDETGVIRRQKQRSLGNFIGFPHASHRDGRHNPRNHVCRLPTRQRRIDWTRTNNIRPDMPIFEIRSPMAVAAEINDGDVGFHSVHTFQGLAADKNNEA
jgi:hypothetical protein